MKVVINKCYGGFGLSPEAIEYFYKLKGIPVYFYVQVKYKFRDGYDEYRKVSAEEANSNNYIGSAFTLSKDLGYSFRKWPEEQDTYYLSQYNIERNDPLLVKTVEDLGDKANGSCAKLRIIEIPDNVKWRVEEYDGQEWIAEEHRTWS